MKDQDKKELIKKKKKLLTVALIIFVVVIAAIAAVKQALPEAALYCYAAIAIFTLIMYIFVIKLILRK